MTKLTLRHTFHHSAYSNMRQVQYTPSDKAVSNYGEGYTNPNEVYEVEHLGQKVCMMKVATNVYTMIDPEYVDKIKKYVWSQHKHTGYITHSINKTSAKEVGEINSISLHQYVLKYCAGKPCPKDLSVDHINRVKIDNRVSNLRYATQSLQNVNRERVCAIRQEPLDELKAIGIDSYPKYTRYDNSQQRFIIDKHPSLPIEKNYVSGTRSGGIVNRYHDLVKTGVLLDNQMPTGEAPFINAWHEYSNIATEFNAFIITTGSVDSEVFDVSFHEINASFRHHLLIIENFVGKDKDNEILMQDKHILCSDSEFTLTKEMMPKYVGFAKETKARGCKFVYDKREEDGTRTLKALSSGSKKVSLKDKFDEMTKALALASIGN